METKIVQSKVTVELLKQIPLGGALTFQVESVRQMYSGRVNAYIFGSSNPDKGIKFKTRSDIDKKQITVYAVPINE